MASIAVMSVYADTKTVVRTVYWPYVALRNSNCTCLIFGVSIGLDPG